MFDIGEYVVFGTDGVCRVEAVGALDIEGVSRDKMYYTLSLVGKVGNNKIFAPVESKRVVMRKILTKDEVNSFVKQIGEIEPLNISDDRKREETYKTIMQSCDCTKLVSLIKSINCRRTERAAIGKKLPAVDERYLNLAENTLYSELCLPLNIDKREVRRYIADTVGIEKYIAVD